MSLRALVGLLVALTAATALDAAFAHANERPTLAEAWEATGTVPHLGARFDDADTVDVCAECDDPAFNLFGLEFIDGDLWVLAFDGTMYRMSADRCQIIQQISIQSFIGLAAGLGYDSHRDLILVTDPVREEILRLTRQGVVVDTMQPPGTGAVGIAYDPTRDRYWITDFEADLIQSVDAETGAFGPEYFFNFGNRLAGTAYDPVLDAIVYNSRGFDGIARPPSTHWLAAEDGRHLRSVPAPLLSINNGTGVGVAPNGDVWIHHTELVQSVCVAKRELEPPTPALPTSWGRLKMLYR